MNDIGKVKIRPLFVYSHLLGLNVSHGSKKSKRKTALACLKKRINPTNERGAAVPEQLSLCLSAAGRGTGGSGYKRFHQDRMSLHFCKYDVMTPHKVVCYKSMVAKRLQGAVSASQESGFSSQVRQGELRLEKPARVGNRRQGPIPPGCAMSSEQKSKEARR